MGKKKTFGQAIIDFFADSSPFMHAVGQAALVAAAGLCWLVTTLPVFTGGAALTALYTVLLERTHLTYDVAFRQFFRCFRRQFRRTLPLWLLALAVCGVLSAAWYLAFSLGLTNRFLLMLPLLLASAAAAFTMLWLFPLLAARDLGRTETLAAAFLLGLRELWRSLILVLLEGAAAALTLFCAHGPLTLTGLWLLFGGGVTAWLKLLVMGHALKAPSSNP